MSSFFSNPLGTVKDWASSPMGLAAAPFFGGIGNLASGLGLGQQQGSTTSTQTNAPWGPQQPYLQNLFSQAQGLNQQNPASLVPAYSPYTNQALNTMGQGIPGYDNLTNLTNQTLSGGFLNSNPYLDQTYNQAANQVKSSMSSMFGGAGRFGSGAMANATANSLGNLANNIYGTNYQNERTRQQQMAALAPSILSAPSQMQLQAGQMQDQRNQALAMAPWNQLGLYQGAISGNYGGTQTMNQPYYQNKGAGLLGGALSGAALGKMIPALGTGWGAGLGALMALA